ncbi:hypothetical protein, partial [uncultured Tateyamaria sp.]|uniref:hypothetical protein n=1 Tax=uncultured Tateyamaria sp. TaxID=455651 RepID=UPI0026132637
RVTMSERHSLSKTMLSVSKAVTGYNIDEEVSKRRAHWVQGHFMRNRAGGISWRNPHVRGAGPLIEQERHVSFDEE